TSASMDNRRDRGEQFRRRFPTRAMLVHGHRRSPMREDLRSFERRADVTRRQFVVTTLAAGFALAVRPVRGDTITTDAQGLEAGGVRIPVGGGEIPGYRARPQGAKKAPMVLVVQEIFGVHEHIRDVCRRLAKLGYVAIAPELYARQGDVSKIADVQEIMS